MSVSNVRILVQDGHRSAVLGATSEAMPIANTQNPFKSRPWRSTDTAEQTITGVMDITIAEGELFGISIAHHNLSSAAEVTVALKSGMTTVDTVTVLDNDTTTWDYWGVAEGDIDQYLITIDDPTNLAGYFQLGQILLGRAITFAYNFEIGATHMWRQDVEHEYTAGQSLRSEGTLLMPRESSINLKKLSPADRIVLVRELRRAGQAAPLYLSLYPGAGGALESDHAYVAKCVSNLSTKQSGQAHWDSQLLFKEA